MIMIWALGSLLLMGNPKPSLDVVRFVDVKKTQKIVPAEIDPLPEVILPEKIQYLAFNLKSPFDPPITSLLREAPPLLQKEGQGRTREVLESYPLDALKMVGTLKRKETFFALIKDNHGIIHRVAKGNYVGQNEGCILNITEHKIEIQEFSRAGERYVEMLLSQ